MKEDSGIPAEVRKELQEKAIAMLSRSYAPYSHFHGFYVGTPVLDVDRLSEIRKTVSIPLVLHGASGLTSEQVTECVKRGICKVNFATELRKAYTDAEKALYAEQPDTFDPKKFGKAGMAAVTELVEGRMKVCGCDGKA